MATKNKPGAYDCYALSEPDEPMFILLGRDPAASWMVRLWVLIREGKRHEAELMLDTAIRYVQASGKTLSGPKAHEARMCAADMVKWYNDLQAAAVLKDIGVAGTEANTAYEESKAKWDKIAQPVRDAIARAREPRRPLPTLDGEG